MSKISYLTSSLYDARIFEWDTASDAEDEKIISLLQMDEIPQKIVDNTNINELLEEGNIIPECCLFYEESCGVLCVEGSDNEVIVKDIFWDGKLGRELVLVMQSLFMLVQSPLLAKRVITFDFESDEKITAISKIMKGVSSSDQLDIDPMFDFISDEEFANLETYAVDIHWGSILEELRKCGIAYTYEYADYSLPRLFIEAGSEVICFIYSLTHGEDEQRFVLSAYQTAMEEDNRVLTQEIASITEEADLPAEYIVSEEIKKVIESL